MSVHLEDGKINENILMFDVLGWKHEHTTSSFIVKGDNIAIMDPGGKSSGEMLLKKLDRYNLKPDSVKYIFLSHRHNDHAGGAPVLLKTFKSARIYASSITLQNLKNPEKINNATISLYGDLAEPIDAVTEESRLIPIEDGDTFDLGQNMKIRAIYTPGHTSDHFMFYEQKNKFLFTGDGAGLFSGKYLELLPNSFPPSFRVENYLNSIKKILNLDFEIVGFSHYGAVSGSQAKKVILNGIPVINEWNDLIRSKGSASSDILLKKYIGNFDLFPEYFRDTVMKIIIEGFRKNF